MPCSVSWHTLSDELDHLPDGVELIAPLSHDRFRITDVQEHRVVITLDDSGDRRSLPRDQFETLYRRIQDSKGAFDLDRLPPDADPYPAVLSLHPRFEIDEERGVITEREGPTATQLADDESGGDDNERVEPDGLDVYSDTLFLIDALERHDVSDLTELETTVLVNIYTICSDVQRNANESRKDVADVLLDRLHHDRPVHASTDRFSGRHGAIAHSKTTKRYRPCLKTRVSTESASRPSIRARWTKHSR